MIFIKKKQRSFKALLYDIYFLQRMKNALRDMLLLFSGLSSHLPFQ